MLSKGLVAPAGTSPSTLVRERLGDRPAACLGGPAHAVEAVERGASLTVATRDRTFAALLSSAFRKGGVTCETSSDLVGIELAGVAKNAAALAAGAALADGPNAAGAAAGRVYAECYALAKARGADADSFVGAAGAGDLVATVLAAHSRNRRAGELLAQGMAPDDIPSVVGQSGGAMRISSEPHLGTKVELWLPVSNSVAAEGAKAAAASPRVGQPRSLRVLVVDDDAACDRAQPRA